jgi:hypothetical protein
MRNVGGLRIPACFWRGSCASRKNSPFISCVSRQRHGQYRIEGASFIGGGAGDDATPKEVAEYLARGPHWAHLMRFTLAMGWEDVHLSLAKL